MKQIVFALSLAAMSNLSSQILPIPEHGTEWDEAWGIPSDTFMHQIPDLTNTQRLMIQSIYDNLKRASYNHPSVNSTFEWLVTEWAKSFKDEDNSLNQLLIAVDFAAKKHEGQGRIQDKSVPYIVHPLRVAAVLWFEGGVRNLESQIAAILHDTLEDTDATPDEIATLFGPQVLSLVQELTIKKGETEIENAQKLSRQAKIIRIADRIQNLRDLLDHPPAVWNEQMVQKFIERSAKLHEALYGAHPYLEDFYTAALDALAHHKS